MATDTDNGHPVLRLRPRGKAGRSQSQRTNTRGPLPRGPLGTSPRRAQPSLLSSLSLLGGVPAGPQHPPRGALARPRPTACGRVRRRLPRALPQVPSRGSPAAQSAAETGLQGLPPTPRAEAQREREKPGHKDGNKAAPCAESVRACVRVFTRTRDGGGFPSKATAELRVRENSPGGGRLAARLVERPTLDFGPGHDPGVVGSGPASGSALSGESTWGSLSPSSAPVPPMCAPSKIKKKFFLKRERIHRARRARVLLRKVCEGTGRKGIPGRTRGDTGRVAADWTERHPLRRGGPPER